MVSPIYIIAVLLGIAFLLGLFKQPGAKFARLAAIVTLAFPAFVSVSWLVHFILNPAEPFMVYTAGALPPFSINLKMGLEEAFMTSAVNLLGFFGFMYLNKTMRVQGTKAVVLFMILIMGMNVVIMTRDIFNLFVFLE
ncbi:MAG: NADH-quinone oxidoreductase subunit F, partial [Bacteroidota bacterium]